MWGQIIGAGISALGSLFGGGDDEQTTMEVDYKKMARNAEKAGFNPLTAIRNGGSAGFTTTHHPGLSMQTRLGNAFATLGNAIMAFDPNADARAAQEEAIRNAELQRLNLTNQYLRGGMAFGDVPTSARSSVVDAQGRSLYGDGSSPSSAKPFWTYYRDQETGRVMRISSSDLPDLEQLPVGGGMLVGDELGLTGAPQTDRELRGPVGPVANPKPQGNPPSAPLAPGGLVAPGVIPPGVGKAVRDWFKPWESEFEWYGNLYK